MGRFSDDGDNELFSDLTSFASAFDKLVGKLEDKGHSAEGARKIAASIGDKKYGVEGMAKKAAAARKGG